MRYLVKWEIDIDADSPKEAAQKALEIQRDPESTALYFTVIAARNIKDIDLMDEEEG